MTNKTLELTACTAMRARQLAYPTEAAVHTCVYVTLVGAVDEMGVGVAGVVVGELAKAGTVLIKTTGKSIQATQKLRFRYLNATIVIYFLDKTASDSGFKKAIFIG